jgi:hypothetical protein
MHYVGKNALFCTGPQWLRSLWPAKKILNILSVTVWV